MKKKLKKTFWMFMPGIFWPLLYKKVPKTSKGPACSICKVNCETFFCPCSPDEILVKRW